MIMGLKDRFSTWEDLTSVRMAFLPVGSLEQHGLHLPLGTDGFIAETVARELASRFTHTYLLPLLPFSSSFEHASFPGSISMKVTTITMMISDVVESLSLSGINRLVVITGHMGNHLLRNVVQELNHPLPKVLLIPSHHHWEKAYRVAGLSTTPRQDMHAGEGETSIIMHLFPDAVRTEKAKDVDCVERPLMETLGMKTYTDTGAIGFPSQASEKKGVALLSALVNELFSVIKEFTEIG